MNDLKEALRRLEKAAKIQKTAEKGDSYKVKIQVEYEKDKIFWEVDISAMRMKVLTNPPGYVFSMDRLHDAIGTIQDRLKSYYKSIIRAIATSGKLAVEGKQSNPFNIGDGSGMYISDNQLFLKNKSWGFTAMTYGFNTKPIGEEETIQILKDAVQNVLGKTGAEISYEIK